MAAWNPEQRATQKLLSNDFREPRWKKAALKNAYVLLGRHRYGSFARVSYLNRKLANSQEQNMQHHSFCLPTV